MDWGGHAHRTFYENRFYNSSEIDEKVGGGGSFSPFTEIGTGFFLFKISCNCFVCVTYNQSLLISFIRFLEYSSIVFEGNSKTDIKFNFLLSHS